MRPTGMLNVCSANANSRSDPAAITGSSGSSSANHRSLLRTAPEAWISSRNSSDRSTGMSRPSRSDSSPRICLGSLDENRAWRGSRSKFSSTSSRFARRAASRTSQVLPTCRAPRRTKGRRLRERSQARRSPVHVLSMVYLSKQRVVLASNMAQPPPAAPWSLGLPPSRMSSRSPLPPGRSTSPQVWSGYRRKSLHCSPGDPWKSVACRRSCRP